MNPVGINLPVEALHDVPQAIWEKSLQYVKVAVIGLGYVGLPTAMLFAKKGFNVQGIDINTEALAAIQDGSFLTRYKELAPWWQDVEESGGFRVGVTPESADVFLITVPTPVDEKSKACDLNYVRSAVESILPVLHRGNLVVLESTVPPGTTREVVKPLLESTGLVVGDDIHLCFSPERILPGNTLEELLNNDRVIGGITQECAMLGKAILARAIQGKIFMTDDLTAEFCKVAENTYRDVNIALANELSLIADQLGINIHEALPLINRHPRVNLHRPGIGVGGHCIAVDPWFLVQAAPEIAQLIALSRTINDRMPEITVNKILKLVENIPNPRITLAGLTYKPDVADTRESPAMEIFNLLKARNVEVIPFDPLLPEFKHLSLLDAVEQSDCLAVLVNHSIIQAEITLNRQNLLDRMRTPNICVF